jgi:DNA-binding response OmpR family regulator
MRILVVEDEPLIALEVHDVLADAGFEVIGPAATAREGLALISAGPIDAAVLDVNLGRETSEAVARELSARGVPFLAVSGYAAEQRPGVFEKALFLAKPFRAVDLVTSIRKLCGS